MVCLDVTLSQDFGKTLSIHPKLFARLLVCVLTYESHTQRSLHTKGEDEMKKYWLFLLIAVMLFAPYQGHADEVVGQREMFFCQHDGRLHTASITLEGFRAALKNSARPPEMQRWPCKNSAIYMVVPGSKVEPENADNSVFGPAFSAWLTSDYEDLRQAALTKYAGQRFTAASWQDLYLKVAFEFYQDDIMRQPTPKTRLDRLVFWATCMYGVVERESGGKPTSLSTALAMGPAQIAPSTMTSAAIVKVWGYNPPNPYDPEGNLQLFLVEFAGKMEKARGWVAADAATWTEGKGNNTKTFTVTGFGGRSNWLQWALWAYNYGSVGVLQHKQKSDLNKYAPQVISKMREYCPGIDLEKGLCTTTPAWAQAHLTGKLAYILDKLNAQ